MKKKPDPVAPKKDLLPAELIIADTLTIIDEYVKTQKAILDEYAVELMLGDGIMTELNAGYENLAIQVGKLEPEEVEEPEMSLDTIIEKLGDEDIDEEKAVEILEKLDEEHVREWIRGQGYSYIKVENLAMQMKLDDFISTELYPYYSDQEKMVM